MRLRRAGERGGSSLLEFVYVGIPVIFVLISTFEIARGMWTYHSLASGVKQGTRYAIVHGSNCAQSPNSCTVTIGQIAGVINNASLGLDTSQFNLTFTPYSGSAQSCLLSDCLSSTAVWPPLTANSPGMSVTISATYPFKSIISMIWPVARGGTVQFGAVNLPASSRDIIQF